MKKKTANWVEKDTTSDANIRYVGANPRCLKCTGFFGI